MAAPCYHGCTVSRLDADGGPADALPSGAPLGREFGKYRLTRRLARGGMGEVYLARLVGELGFEKQLVIKTILPELAEKPRFIEMFAAEAKTAVALSHGNIVPAYELGRAADTFYIAMGYVDGPSVAQMLEMAEAKGRAPDIAAGLHVIRGVLAGLAYAHREEPGRPAVVHRDITPRNVLIDRSGQVRIVDFGIAAPARRQVGVRAGSIGYMSPEQARGDAADPRADVFSVGCMLYELCTHARAFPKEGIWVPPDLEQLPEEVREPLERSLAVDPDARFKDASAMNAALRAAFSKHIATYDDATLARTLTELFPHGWGRGDERESGDSGESPVLAGPSETYATRLTAVTGIDPSALLPEGDASDALPTDAEAPEGPEATGPNAQEETPPVTAEDSTADSSEADTPRGGLRVSSLAAVLGALGIGVGAFAIGRIESCSVDDPPIARTASGPTSPQAVSAAVDPPSRQAEHGVTSPPELPDPAPSTQTSATPPVQQRLQTRPTNAVVTVDGTRHDGPPYSIAVPAEGSVEVVVSAKGHRSKTLELGAADVTDQALSVELEPTVPKNREPGELRVFAPTVAWARVLVDGKRVGDTPTRRISLPSGRHKVEVRCVPDVCVPERTLYKQSVVIEPGRLTRIDAKN